MSDFHPLRSLEDEIRISSHWSAKNSDAVKLAKDIPCAPMPSLRHLKTKDFEEVYEPSDDTVRIISMLCCLVFNAECVELDHRNT